MKFLVLGCGMQGRAVIYDLLQSSDVQSVLAADVDLSGVEGDPLLQDDRFSQKVCDATNETALKSILEEGFDVVVDMLPVPFARPVAQVAIAEGVHMVNSNYGKDVYDLHEKAKSAGVTLFPECGLDPGIDLILCGEMLRYFDEIYELNSYGGGLPEPSAADNLLQYKITWTYEGVLKSYSDDAKLLKESKSVDISYDALFDEENIHYVEVPGLGEMEATPNRDVFRFLEQMGIGDSCRTAGRYTLRWPGHAVVMRPFSRLGFLSTEPVREGLPSPRDFLKEVLEPKLQLGPRERDVIVIRVEAAGVKGGKEERVIQHVIDYRDLETGFTAMNRTVGYTASIMAQMIARGEISSRGVLSPLYDVPYGKFMEKLSHRGITIN